MAHKSVRTYAEALKLVEKWPKDPTKTGSDLGEHLRTLVKAAFPTGPTSPRANDHTARQLAFYRQLAENTFEQANPRLFRQATFTKVSEADLRDITTVGNFEKISATLSAQKLWQRISWK
ncbi:ubiquinol-cytochrome-c reductase complex assembly factor 2-like [Tigriopus californicus]|uniref:ubiquinol-cytochrome-c reductase complex assembly factor 2-like n=1 Tax=Tigriopus californicus TaxID=6832 RepID=UPI0027DA7D66|nr:ubiquinol-cytochrome-c reductase complex assembly factor 2-like [Tigriopus californicus]